MPLSPEAATFSVGTRTIRKVQIRILPYILLLYIISFLDRINIGFAALTMNKELGITSQQFGFLVGIFFISYSLFEIPSNLILHSVSARIWLARILIVWGIVAALSGLVHTVHQLYVVRFLFGMAEAGFYPGILLYLTYWFRQREQARAIGPAEAKFLTESEKDWIATELKDEEDNKRGTYQLSTAGALGHKRVWHLAGAVVFHGAVSNALFFWVPQLVKAFSRGYSNTTVGLLVMLPYTMGLLAMILISRSSDRRLERRWHVAIPATIGGVACLMFGATHSILFVVLFLSVAVGCVCGYLGPFWALPSEFLTGSSAASGIALITTFVNLGGFVGPYAFGYIRQKTESYYEALAIGGIVLFVFATLVLLLPRVSRGLRDGFSRPSSDNSA